MKKFLWPMLLVALTAVSLNGYAVDEAEMESIKAECQDEAKDAQYPEEYAEDCIKERLQAIQDEEQGGSEKEPSDRG